MKLRIATFNLENFGFGKPGQKPTLQERIAVMRPQLQRVNADILCLQEVNGQKEDDTLTFWPWMLFLMIRNMPVLTEHLPLTRRSHRFMMNVTSLF